MNDLLHATYQLLDTSRFGYAELAKAAQVNERWLRYLVARKYKDPGVKSVQAVYNELSKRKNILPVLND